MASKIWYEVEDKETRETYYLWAWTSYGATEMVSKENNIPKNRLKVVDVEDRKLKEYVTPRWMAY